MNKKIIKLILIVLVIILVFGLFKYFGLDKYLTFQALKDNQDKLLGFVKSNYLMTIIVYFIIYTVNVIFVLPGASILTIAGGYMYGPIVAALIINVAATLGATIVFIMVKYFIGENIQKKYEKQLEKFNKEVDENGYSYFLIVRFIPVFPFFLINMLAGLTKVKLFTFVWTTSIGILPGSLVYAYAGSNLKHITSPSGILSKEILFAFLALAAFAMFPRALKKILGKNKQKGVSQEEE